MRITMAWDWGRKKPVEREEPGSSVRTRSLEKNTLKDPALDCLISDEKEIARVSGLASSARTDELVRGFRQARDPVAFALGLDDLEAIVAILRNGVEDHTAGGILREKLSKANTSIMMRVFRHSAFLESARIGLFYPPEAHVGGGLPLIFGSHMDHMIMLGKEICVFVREDEKTTSHSVNERGEILAKGYDSIAGFSPDLLLIPPTDDGSRIPRLDAYGICVCYGFQSARLTSSPSLKGAASTIITEQGELGI